MKVLSVEQFGDWQTVRNVSRLTKGKKPINTDVSESFKIKMLVSRHEPLKLLNFLIRVECPQWVAMHLVRHKHATHFAESSRPDITDTPRDPNRIIQYAFMANPIALMDMAEKRICKRASDETRELMRMIAFEIRKTEPLLADRLKSQCVVKGYCPEQFEPCGHNYSDNYKIERENYLRAAEQKGFFNET